MTTTIDGTAGVTFPAGGVGNPAGAVVGTTDTQTLTNKTLTGAVINGTVGATTPAAGAFTTLSATGNVTLGDAVGDVHTTNGLVQIGQGTFAARTGVKGVIAAGVTTGDIHCQLGDSGATWQWINAANSLAVMNLSNAGALSVSGTLEVTNTISSSTSTGGAYSVKVSGTQKAAITTHASITGSGADYTPSYFSETGLGAYWMVNGSTTKAMTLDASGNLIVGATSTRGTYKLDIRSNTGIAIGSNATYFGTIDYSAGTGLLSLAAESGGGINFLSGSTERARIDSSGNVLVTNPAGLGYGTGAGGSVTQATSKATAVTLNKPCGTITLAADALASNTTARFSFNNSILAITDTVILIIRNGVTAGAYLVWVDGTAAGSCTLAIRNISGGSLSDAVVLNFSIIKGVTA